MEPLGRGGRECGELGCARLRAGLGVSLGSKEGIGPGVGLGSNMGGIR